MTSRRRPADAPAPELLAGGTAGEPGIPLDRRDAANAEASPTSPAADGDPAAVSVAGFAAQLRELREQAGRPSYRKLSQLAHYSHTALSQAAGGCSLPSLAVTHAFVGACGGDVDEWSARWHQVDQATRPRSTPVPRPARPASRWTATSQWLRAKGRVTAAAAMAGTACIAAVVLWAVSPSPVTGQTEQVRPHLEVESSGLYVRYVVVTNLGTRAGYAWVVNTGADKVHRSPRPVPPSQSWTYFFNRSLKDGAQICGSINPGPAVCATVRA